MGAAQSQQQLETENLTIDVFHGNALEKKISLPLIPNPAAGPGTFDTDLSPLIKMLETPRKAFAKEIYRSYPKQANGIMKAFDDHVKYRHVSMHLPFINYRGPFHPVVMPMITTVGVVAGLTLVGVSAYGTLQETKAKSESANLELEITKAKANVELETAKIQMESAKAKAKN